MAGIASIPFIARTPMFNPLNFGTTLAWYDGSLSECFILDENGLIQEVRDDGPRDLNATQATAAARPTIGAIGDLPAIQCSATQSVASPTPTVYTGAVTMSLVFRIEEDSSAPSAFIAPFCGLNDISTGDDSDSFVHRMEYATATNPDNMLIANEPVDNGGVVLTMSTGSSYRAYNTTYNLITVLNPTPGNATQWVNGVKTITSTSTASSYSPIVGPLRLGSSFSATGPYSLLIGEWALWEGVLTDAVIEDQVYPEVQDKWSIV